MHARPGSRATFRVPQNSFVWENKKNRLTATKRLNHFARVFDMRAHMKRLDETSRMVVFPVPYDACGRQERRFCARSRVGSS